MNIGLTGATVTNGDLAMFDSVHVVAGGNFTTADGEPALGIALYFTSLDGLLEHLTNTGGVARPGGSDKAVQYNYAGRFGGESAFTWDYTNNNLIVGATSIPFTFPASMHTLLTGASPGHAHWAFGADYAGFIALMKANGSPSSLTALLTGETIGRVRGRGHDGTAWSNTQAEVRFVTTEGWSVGNHGAGLEFYYTPDGSTTLTKVTDTAGLLELTDGSTTTLHDHTLSTLTGVTPKATFTPVIVGGTTAGVGTYTTQEGYAEVLNDIVFYQIALVWTAHTGTGTMSINGLPYSAAAIPVSPPAIVNWNNITLSAVGNKIFAQLTTGTSIISLNEIGSGAASALAIDTAGVLRLSGWYFK